MFKTLLEIISIRVNADYVVARAGRQTPLFSLAGRLLAFGAGIVRSIVAAPGEIASLVRVGRVPLICFSSTMNQTTALEPIVASMADLRWIVVNQSRPADGRSLRYPSIIVSLVSILTLPATLAFSIAYLLFPRGDESFSIRVRALAFSFDEVLRAYAYLAAAHVLLARHRPGAVIMSNDHNAINRALCLAGGKRGVKTVYIQHAPVTDVFPRLVCSHAFLDSEVSAEIYRRRPTATAIEVLGASRYDATFRNDRPGGLARTKTVSLCFNKVDEPAQLLAYYHALVERDWDVIWRPHPGIARRDLAFLPADAQVDRAPIHQHLRKVNFLIAGNSGVLLDAYMAGVVPVMATDLSKVSDYYGFLQRQAVYSISLETIPAFDEECQGWSLEALAPGMKSFNAAVGTSEVYSVADQIRCRIVEMADRANFKEGVSGD